MACGAALLQAIRGDLSHNAHENVTIDMGPKFLGHIEEGVDSHWSAHLGVVWPKVWCIGNTVNVSATAMCRPSTGLVFILANVFPVLATPTRATPARAGDPGSALG